jgi:protein TonB
MNFARVGISVALGGVITLGLLFLMYVLINNELVLPDASKETRIADIQMPKQEIETRFEEAKPDKPQEPEAPPPDIPEPTFEGPNTNLAGLNMEIPRFEGQIAMNIGTGFSGDGDYLPIVKVAPEYPNTASSRGIEGSCMVEFTVTTTGTTRDVRAIESDCITSEGKPTSVFNRASVRAAERFKYRPKVVDGVAVEVPGIRNRFTYELAK